MARLPTYQQTGRVFTSLPQLDFVNVAESMKRSRSMMEGIDRLSSFAFQQAGETAKKAALQVKPITLEQLEEAQQSGITAEDLVKAQGGGVIFQNTLRKVQAEQLKNQLEVEANKESLSILTKVKTGEIQNSQEVKSKFNGVLDGMSEVLFRLDPETAAKFKITAGSLMQNFEKAAYNKLAENFEFEQQIETANYVNEATSLVKELLDTQPDPEVFNVHSNQIRKALSVLALNGGASFASSVIPNWDKKIESLKENFFLMKGSSIEFGTNPLTGNYDIAYALKKIQDGDFGEYSEFYDKNIFDKKKISDNVYTLINTQNVAQKAQREVEKREAENNLKEKLFQVFSGNLTGKNADDVIKQGFSAEILSESFVKQYFESKNGKQPQSQSQAEQAVLAERAIIRGTIKSDDDIKKYYPNLHYEDMIKLMRLLTNDDAKEAAKLHNKFSGVDGDPSFTKPSTQKNYIAIRNEFEKLKEEKNPDGSFVYPTQTDAMLAANEKRIKSANYINSASRQIKAYEALKAFKFNPEQGGFDDWIKKQPEKIRQNLLNTYETWQKNSGITLKTYQELKDEGLN
jgi:hypothetical protein